MAAPTISQHPKSTTVAPGETARFTVVATGASSYEWARNGTPIPGAGDASYEVKATADLSGSKFNATVKNDAGEKRISDDATLTVKATQQVEVPPLYDPVFATRAAWFLAGVFLLVLWPVWVIAGPSAFGEEGSFPAVVAVQLVIVGVLVALAGLYLMLLDFRGKARTLAELRSDQAGSAAGRLGPLDEVAKSLPQLVKEFGQLKPPAAAMVLAAVLFVCATAIAWRGLPDGAKSTTTTTTVAPTTTTTLVRR